MIGCMQVGGLGACREDFARPSELDMVLMARGMRAWPRSHFLDLKDCGEIDLASIDQKHLEGLKGESYSCFQEFDHEKVSSTMPHEISEYVAGFSSWPLPQNTRFFLDSLSMNLQYKVLGLPPEAAAWDNLRIQQYLW